jgi:WD40 repeat protein
MFLNGDEGAFHVYQIDGWKLLLDSATIPTLSTAADNIHRSAREAHFSPDGKSILTCLDDGTARVFEVAAGAERVRVQSTTAIKTTRLSPNGRLIPTQERNISFVSRMPSRGRAGQTEIGLP